jgi:hypothetical protein
MEPTMSTPMQALQTILEELDTQELFLSDFEDTLGEVVDNLIKSAAAATPEVKSTIEAVINSLEQMASPEHDVKDTLLQLSDIFRKCAIDASAS